MVIPLPRLRRDVTVQRLLVRARTVHAELNSRRKAPREISGAFSFDKFKFVTRLILKSSRPRFQICHDPDFDFVTTPSLDVGLLHLK